MNTFKRKTILSITLLILSINVLYAQKKYSSFKSKSFSDVDSAAYYLDSAKYLSDKKPLIAINYINKAIELSIKNNNEANEASAYVILGNIQQQLGQHDMAITNYKKAINLLSENSTDYISKNKIAQKQIRVSSSIATFPDKNLFSANKQITISYLALNKLNDAIASINYCTGSDFPNVPSSEKMDAKRLLALIKQKQKKSKESLDILDEVYNTEVKNGNLYGQVITNIAIGKVHEENRNENLAITYYTKAKNEAEKNNFNKLAIEANDLLAKIYRTQKNVDKELQARNDIIELNIESNNNAAVKKENIEIGNAYLNNKEFHKAESYYEKARQQDIVVTDQIFSNGTTTQPEKLFEKSQDMESNSNTYKLLTQEFLKRNDVKKAISYFKQYTELQDAIKKTRKKEFEDAIALSNEIGQNQQRIDLLEKERELKERSIEILEQDRILKEEQLGMRNIVIGVLVLFIVLMMLAGYFVYKGFSEKKKAHQLLALKSLRGQMNPHFIFNALNSVNHYISQNDERSANRYLSDFSKLMRLVMDTSKYDFITITEELEMLKIYLQLEHLRFDDKFNYNIRFVNKVEQLDYVLPPMLIQPYIENAIWHGLRYIDETGMLNIEFEAKDNSLLITISDNGVGRKKSKELKTQNQKKQLSIGMQNIENRIELMNEIYNSNIKIEITDLYPDKEHSGTQVKLIIPQKHFKNA